MANLLTNPRKWEQKAILIKQEATYGVDPTPTGAADWIEARNVTLTPMEVDKVATNIVMPYAGNAGSVIVGQWAKLSFDIAFVPSGVVATAPKWAALIMACGLAETTAPGVSVIYNLVSDLYSSLFGYINIDGNLHKMAGMRGEVKVNQSAKGAPKMSFSFDSLYLTPAGGLMPTVTRTGWLLEEAVNSKNTSPMTLGTQTLGYSNFDWSLGNKISRIDLPGPQQEICIDDRSPQASLTVLAPPIAVWNPFAIADAGSVIELSVTHGSAAGKKIKTNMHVKIIGVDYEAIEKNLGYKLSLEPVPVNGNDEITLTLL